MCAGFRGTITLFELEPTFSDMASPLIWDSVDFNWDSDFRITAQFKLCYLSLSSLFLFFLFLLLLFLHFLFLLPPTPSLFGGRISCFSFPGMEIIGLPVMWLFSVSWLNGPVFQLLFMVHVKKTTNQQVPCQVFRSFFFFFNLKDGEVGNTMFIQSHSLLCPGTCLLGAI